MSRKTAIARCPWCLGSDLYMRYHDEEWGVPVHDDRRLFELLILEGAQAGLSWSTILNKRENYRRAFARFDPKKVARFSARDAKRLLADAGIVRNRLKIASTIGNARAFLAVQREFGSFDAYLWGFVNGRPLQNRRRSMKEIPARTALSDALSKNLKGRGFSLRRIDHHVRLHAGGRHGQRPPDDLFPARTGRGPAKDCFFG